MIRVTKKAIPLICAMTLPLFMNAEEHSKTAATTMSPSCETGLRQITPPAAPLACNGARLVQR